MKTAAEIVLTADERETLEQWRKSRTMPHAKIVCAEIILHAAGGVPNDGIAGLLGLSPKTVGRWRHRFAEFGLAGLDHEPSRDQHRAIACQVNELLSTPPPDGRCWTIKDLAVRVHRSRLTIRRVCREYRIQLSRHRSLGGGKN